MSLVSRVNQKGNLFSTLVVRVSEDADSTTTRGKYDETQPNEDDANNNENNETTTSMTEDKHQHEEHDGHHHIIMDMEKNVVVTRILQSTTLSFNPSMKLHSITEFGQSLIEMRQRIKFASFW